MKSRDLLVNFDGHQVAVLAANEEIEGPAIIFIPGVMAPINFWKCCLPDAIREKRRWYSISLPGHHPSIVPDNFKSTDVDARWLNRLYQAVIKELVGAEKIIIVGHSTGGFSALNLAANGFDQLLGIVSVAGFFEGKWGGIEGQLVKLANLGQWAKPLFIFSLWASRLFKPVQLYLSGQLAFDRQRYFASPITRSMLKEIQENMKNQNLGALFPLFNRIPTFNIEQQLEKVSVPTVIMAGSHDPVISAEQSLKLAGAIKHAKLVVFNNAGHMPFMERTEQFHHELLEATLRFSNSIEIKTKSKNCF